MNEIDAYIKNNLKYIFDLAMDIARIPSATGDERVKADFIYEKLTDICGKKGVTTDAAGNVLYLHREIDGPGVTVYTAHIDTVFGNISQIEPTCDGNRIYAPSIQDNSINVAGLIFCIRMIRDLGVPLRKNLLFGFDVGEEGYGNLKGIRQIMADWDGKINEVIALDLGYKGVVNKATGSKKYLVTVETEGGHSWNDFGNGNAIRTAADIIHGLYAIEVPSEPKTTYNVGVIKGGTSVNTIAQSCEFDVDIRSTDEKTLQELENTFLAILARSSGDGAKIQSRIIGSRPCGSLAPDSDLLRRVTETRRGLGLDTVCRTASTDANLPLSIGIPAVSFGVCNGGRNHTTEEFIEMDTLETGMKNLAYLLISDASSIY